MIEEESNLRPMWIVSLSAALHETRCRECRVTWKSWAQRLFGIKSGYSPLG